MKPQGKCERCGAKAELFRFENEDVCEKCIDPKVKQTYLRFNPKLAKEIQK